MVDSPQTNLGQKEPPSHLLYSLILELRPKREAALGPTQGYRAYALIMQILHWRDPEYSRQIHDVPGPKPFTISPLRGKFKRLPSGLLVSPDETYRLRLTILQEQLFARLLDALVQMPQEQVLQLESAVFELSGVVTAPGRSEWADFSSFEAILDRARPVRQIGLEFDSPTVFRSSGRRNVLLPLPGLVFGSLLSRWNQFSPVPLPTQLGQLADDGLLIARYRLQTRMLDFGRYREIGFEGDCHYESTADLGDETLGYLSALADYAFYAGVGAKTTMGLGQARRIETRGSAVSGRARGDAAQTG